MELRLAENHDAQQIYMLVQETIKAIYPMYYLKEIVDMFCEFHSRENIIKDIEARNTYLLMENGEIIGTGTTNKNHITRVYVLPQYQKKGYGTFIMNQLEKMIREKYNCAHIDASLPACKLYSHLGYQTVDHGTWECKNGVIIPQLKVCFGYSVFAIIKSQPAGSRAKREIRLSSYPFDFLSSPSSAYSVQTSFAILKAAHAFGHPA